MIIVRLTGGLGNQLFEYSIGRRVALLHGTELKLDLTPYSTYYKLWPYSLDLFTIQASEASEKEISALIGKGRLARKLVRLLSTYGLSRLIREPSFAFYPQALAAKNSSYLEGHWQSYLYFEPIADQLRQELVLKEPFSHIATTCEKNIKSTNAVSLHVRRGDYVGSQFTVLDTSYYERAMRIMEERVKGICYFVFSDDIEWAKKNIPLPFSTVYVSGNGIPPHEELILMSQCQHHIIANSSFGWWGAWLNPSTTKVVVAPRQWFTTDVHDTKDLLPPDWFTT